MAIEIERKYLPKDPAWRPSGTPVRLVQGYLWPGEMAVAVVQEAALRLQVLESGKVYVLALPAADAAELHAATQGQPLDGSWTLRIRTANNAPEGIFCIKGKARGISRPEYEYALDAATTRALLDACRGTQIAKDRYTLERSGYIWEVDVYANPLPGDPAVTIEVELPCEDAAPALPDWVGQEVTQDKRYTNAALARRRWHAAQEAHHGA